MGIRKWVRFHFQPDDFDPIGGPITLARRARDRRRGRAITQQLIREGNPPW